MDEKKETVIWTVTTGPFQKIPWRSGMLADAEVKCAKRTWKEGQTGSVTITDFKPADIDCLLKFIYSGVINPQKSYPREASLPALMKIWKMADFFCLDMMRNLAIKAAKDCSREMALVFCAFDPPPRHDQKKARLFAKDFVPAVRAIYEDEMEILKHDFAPILLGLAVASVHSFSQMEGFERILQDIPPFCSDWATALMKGLPQPDWYPGWGGTQCNREANQKASGTFIDQKA
ncbi:btb poz domain-containing protein [Diaporthe eres]|nr:btb poz domain-containing protein [Diaporthe eres]